MAIEDALSRISTIGARFGIDPINSLGAEFSGVPDVARTIPLPGEGAELGAGDPADAVGGMPDAAGFGDLGLADLAQDLAAQAGSTDLVAAILAQQQGALGLGGDR